MPATSLHKVTAAGLRAGGGSGIVQHQASKRKLSRTCDGPIAGVAGGFARFFGIDPAIMRLVFVALTVLTGGAFVLVYVALWLVMPKDCDPNRPLDVDPNSFDSQAGCGMCGGAADDDGRAPRRSVAFLLVLGALLVAVGMSLLFSLWMPGLDAVQFWPLLLVALGILRLAVPGPKGYSVYAVVEGIVMLVLGVVLLLAGVGVISMDVDGWFAHEWPFLLVVAGLLLQARALRMPAFAVGAAAVLVVFCVLGATLYGAAGPHADDWMLMPYCEVPLDGQAASGPAPDLAGGWSV